MVDSKTISTVTKVCLDKLVFESAVQEDEYYYASVPLCVVDVVFSIGVRYESVQNTVKHLCRNYNIQQTANNRQGIPDETEQLSTTEFLNLFGDKTSEQLATDVFNNRQRTSSRNGILKAEAVVRFLNILKDFNVEYFQHIPRLINNSSFELCIKAIPGQRSGISLKYFFMLAGSDDLIKPDRMIIRFLQSATGQIFDLDKCQTILYGVTTELNQQGHKLTPKLLDNIIWNYQRKAETQKATLTTKFSCGS